MDCFETSILRESARSTLRESSRILARVAVIAASVSEMRERDCMSEEMLKLERTSWISLSGGVLVGCLLGGNQGMYRGLLRGGPWWTNCGG